MATKRECATCGGEVRDDQPTEEIPYTSKSGVTGMASRHTDYNDCSRALSDWSGAGRSPSIDSPDPTGNTWPGLTGRHLRAGMDAP